MGLSRWRTRGLRGVDVPMLAPARSRLCLLGWPGYLLQKCVNFARKTSALVSVCIRLELRISGAVVALKIHSYRIKPESE